MRVPTQSDDFCEESANFWVIRVKISQRRVRRESSQREWTEDTGDSPDGLECWVRLRGCEVCEEES